MLFLFNCSAAKNSVHFEGVTGSRGNAVPIAKELAERMATAGVTLPNIHRFKKYGQTQQ